MVKHHRTTTAALVAGGLLLAGTAFAAPAATAATPAQPGLYGSGDPTYDGAFRQSLALLAHEAAGTTAPAAAVDWLVGQQCADGGFQAFRPSTAVACTPSDPNAFTGEDTNSTALAALALRSVGRTTEADRAIAWLEKARAADGGFPYFVGGASDANSTADVLIALNGAGAPGSSTGPARHYLETLQVGCDGAAAGEDGALAFQDYGTGLVANDAATVQSLVALTRPAVLGAASTPHVGGPKVGPANTHPGFGWIDLAARAAAPGTVPPVTQLGEVTGTLCELKATRSIEAPTGTTANPPSPIVTEIPARSGCAEAWEAVHASRSGSVTPRVARRARGETACGGAPPGIRGVVCAARVGRVPAVGEIRTMAW